MKSLLVSFMAAACLVACSHADEPKTGASNAAVTAEVPDQKCDECDGKDSVADRTKIETIAIGASPTRGSATAPVTVVVFSDFECPFCAKGELTLKELEEQYRGKVRVVFKNSPLPMHEHARLAAKAALAAGQQGKFWEYHDALFAQQDALDRAALDALAKKLGLDVARFDAALDGPALDAALDADLAEAKRVDVKGTPAFFVNGRNVQGAQPLAAFKTKVDQALAER